MSHDEPFRMRVMKAICAQIKTVTPGNGYAHDLSDFVDEHGVPAERVFRGRTIFGQNDPLPLIAVLEDPKMLEPDNSPPSGGQVITPFRILIQGFAQDDKDHPLDPAYRLSADVVRALVRAKANPYDILGMQGRVMSMKFGQPIHRPADDQLSTTAFFLFGITMTLVEDIEKPFD